MAQLPDRVRNSPRIGAPGHDQPLSDYLVGKGFRLTNRGKVRDSYDLPDTDEQMVVVATDRISVFDFVLPALVRYKGEVLTALTHMWLTKVFPQVTHHLVQSDVNPAFNAAYDVRAMIAPEIPIERCLVVRKWPVQPYELIFRKNLGGSVWREYEERGTAAGQPMPHDLQRWAKLETPAFTPSTKEDVGHDVNVTAQSYLDAMGPLGVETKQNLSLLMIEACRYAEQRGIMILDSKFEARDGEYGLLDEVLTPDSSRFTTVESFNAAMAAGTDPVFYDKEPVRNYARTIQTPFAVTGIHKLDPTKPDHLDFVHSLEIPAQILEETTQRYHKIFQMLAGCELHHYQVSQMGL